MSNSSYTGKNIWIIGASSGIGAELAKELAASGAKVIISARSADKLQALQSQIGAYVVPLDAANFEAVNNAAQQIKAELGKINSVIFMAGVYTPTSFENMNIADANQIIDVNFKGALNTVLAVLPILKTQGFGQIALCGSVAGYVGLPNGQPYSATKAAIISLAESLRAEVPSFIDVKLISPGFVKTQLTDKNSFDMPAIITPQQAAKEIAKGLQRKAFEIHFPKKFTYFMKLLQLLPHRLYFILAKKLV
jgi:short-subunit dehydrogenase